MTNRRAKPLRTKLPATRTPSPVPYRMAGDAVSVAVEAVYHVPEISPVRDGPWTGEADKIAWTDIPTGYGCIIRRSPTDKHLCGYVSVPPAHPLYAREVDMLGDVLIGVHGGIDYAEACEEHEPEDRSVCHVRERIVPEGFRQTVHANRAARTHDDAWWFGFSCDRVGDILPEGQPADHAELVRGIVHPTYKTEAFVYRECVRLAVQLKAIEEGRDPREVDPGPAADDYDPRRIAR